MALNPEHSLHRQKTKSDKQEEEAEGGAVQEIGRPSLKGPNQEGSAGIRAKLNLKEAFRRGQKGPLQCQRGGFPMQGDGREQKSMSRRSKPQDGEGLGRVRAGVDQLVDQPGTDHPEHLHATWLGRARLGESFAQL